jgi:N-sulfoglucosamine sulfohydrolase
MLTNVTAMRSFPSLVIVAAFLLAEISPAARGQASRPAPSTRPNILFAVADDWGFGHAGAYGCRWVKTPAFDRVAAGGMLFEQAYTPNAKCAPSRACILTGRNSWQLKAGANHESYFPPEFRTYAEALALNGYTVGETAKGWAPGIALDVNGKKRQMAGAPFNDKTAPPPTRDIANNDYAGNFEAFLATTEKGKPWCFWYGCFEPHRGYEYGSGVAKGGKKLSDIDQVPAMWPDTPEVRNDMLDYAFEVEHFDRHLGRMLDLLQQRGELENTIVVVTSDNGMSFPHDKGQEYEMSNHLPLAIMWPAGIKHPGRKVDDYVSFIDFAPTFVELAGLTWEQTGMAAPAGRSLTDILYAEAGGRVHPARDHVLIGKEQHDVGRPKDVGYPIRGIVKDGHLYLRNFEPMRWPAGNPETGYLNCDGGPTKTAVIKARNDPQTHYLWEQSFGLRPPEELYDLKADPQCLHNLAGVASSADLKAALAWQLTEELTAQEDPRMSGHGDVFDTYPRSNAVTRDFYERFMRGEKVKAGWVNPSDFDRPATDAEKQPAKAPADPTTRP